MTRKWIALGVAPNCTTSVAVLAQEEPLDRPGRRLRPASGPEVVVEPETIPDDPDRALLERFHRDLDVSTDAERRLRLERARSLAPIDVSWSLR